MIPDENSGKLVTLEGITIEALEQGAPGLQFDGFEEEDDTAPVQV
jgi:hypothetical protein